MRATIFSLILLACSLASAQLPVIQLYQTQPKDANNPFGDMWEGWHFNYNGAFYKAIIANSNDLVIAAGLETYTTNTSNHGDAVSFTTQNTTGGLNVSDNNTVGMGVGVSFTYTCWMNFPVAPNNPLVAKWNFTKNHDYELTSSAGILYWLTRNTNDTAFTQMQLGPGGTVSLNAWHFIVFGYDDSIKKTFCSLDNANYTNFTANGVIRDATVSFNIGQYDNAGASASMRAVIDELYLWHRVLTTAEITYVSTHFFPGSPN